MSMEQDDIRKVVDDLVEVTYQHALYTAAIYRTKNVVMMFGDDFAHPQAAISYETMDSIIKIAK